MLLVTGILKEWVMGSSTLVIVYNVSQMVSSTVMSLADAHRIVCEVHIAVVAWGRSG